MHNLADFAQHFVSFMCKLDNLGIFPPLAMVDMILFSLCFFGIFFVANLIIIKQDNKHLNICV